MIHIPISRWGEPYKSSEADRIVHFDTGEVVCEMSRAVGAMVGGASVGIAIWSNRRSWDLDSVSAPLVTACSRPPSRRRAVACAPVVRPAPRPPGRPRSNPGRQAQARGRTTPVPQFARAATAGGRSAPPAKAAAMRRRGAGLTPNINFVLTRFQLTPRPPLVSTRRDPLKPLHPVRWRGQHPPAKARPRVRLALDERNLRPDELGT